MRRVLKNLFGDGSKIHASEIAYKDGNNVKTVDEHLADLMPRNITNDFINLTTNTGGSYSALYIPAIGAVELRFNLVTFGTSIPERTATDIFNFPSMYAPNVTLYSAFATAATYGQLYVSPEGIVRCWSPADLSGIRGLLHWTIA